MSKHSDEVNVAFADDVQASFSGDEPFIRYPISVMRNPNISHGAKILYGMLLSFAWSKRRGCWPGQFRLAAYMGISERQIRTYTKELKDLELVAVERRGMNMTNKYVILRIPDRFMILEEAVEDTVKLEMKRRKNGTNKKAIKSATSTDDDDTYDETMDRKNTSYTDRKNTSDHDRQDTSALDRKDTSDKVDKERSISSTEVDEGSANAAHPSTPKRRLKRRRNMDKTLAGGESTRVKRGIEDTAAFIEVVRYLVATYPKASKVTPKLKELLREALRVLPNGRLAEKLREYVKAVTPFIDNPKFTNYIPGSLLSWIEKDYHLRRKAEWIAPFTSDKTFSNAVQISRTNNDDNRNVADVRNEFEVKWDIGDDQAVIIDVRVAPDEIIRAMNGQIPNTLKQYIGIGANDAEEPGWVEEGTRYGLPYDTILKGLNERGLV